MCDKYLLSYYKEIITDILKDPEESKQFSLNINFVELSGNDPNLGNIFLRDPEESLEQWNEALHKVQTNLTLQSEENYTIKKNTHCRIYSLPLYPELHRTKFPLNEDTNKFLQVTGTVVRMTAVKMLEYQRQYICTKCKYVMAVNAEYEMKNIITPPRKCENPEECKGTNLVRMGELNAEFCQDYQEIKMQETVSKLDVGSVPNSTWVTLEDDLVDSCKPGDNITVCGLVKRRQNQFVIGKRIEVELVIKANHVHVNNNSTSALSLTPELKDMFNAFWKTYADTPLAARDIILKSICPQLFGLYIVKLAVAVVLAGGSNIRNTSNTEEVRVRAEPHLLLVGDPSTGKSQLLRFASKIIPRSVLTTGVGSTAAGLTVTAVMENGEWQLEGGALVMADGGICCIDEFNTMKEHDRASIHEAMEQQTISVAKASIVCKLSTRCSILAATNPKGNLDPSQPLFMNIALKSPLLSRFDLILLLRDTLDDEWDSKLVDHICSYSENCNSSKLSENINWNIETLQAYFAVIKKIQPVLTEDSNRILSGYYQARRRTNYRNKSGTTVRLLDSLVRLSQGHARLMYHEEVKIVDAIMAVILVESGVEPESSVFNLRINVKNDFSQDPTSNYQELIDIVLKKLDLNDLIEKARDGIINTKTSNRSGPSTGKSSSLTTGSSSKFFHAPKPLENIKQKNKSIIVEKAKRNDDLELSAGTSGIRLNEEVDNFEEEISVGHIEIKTKPKTTTANMKSTTKNHDTDTQLKEIQKSTNKHSENKKSRITEQSKCIKVTRGDDSSTCEKENKCMESNAKRKQSKDSISTKEIKLKKTENVIHHDLAALRCMPSVHDIFKMEDCTLGDDDDGLNFDGTTGNNVCNTVNASTCLHSNESKTETVRKETKSDNEEPPHFGNNESLKQHTSKALSQKTRTKNFFSKFKFIPKANESANDESLAGPVSSNNSVVSATHQLSDISFANVVTSTQSEKPVTENVDFGDTSCIKANPVCDLENRSMHDQTNTKRFNFKQVTNPYNLKAQNTPRNEPTSSIFESQEDRDNLDLDI